MATKLGLALVIVCTLYVHAFAQSSQSSCKTVIVSQLASCLSYITGSSSSPDKSCCSGLESVVKSQPQCLCQVIGPNAGSLVGVPVNQTQALALPGACNVQTPSPTLCSAINGGAAAVPTASPSTPTTATPSSVTPSQASAPSSSPAKPAASTPASATPATNGVPMSTAPSLMALAVIFLVSTVSASF
ncbi:unnamed protein product [Victoria cruziana]